jgi:hypothetical protein
MFLLGISFDEMDAASDVGYLYPYTVAGANTTVDASTPNGVGKSLVIYSGIANGGANLGVSLPTDQAGKTLNVGFRAKLLAAGVFFSLHSVDVIAGKAQQIGLVRNESGYLELWRGASLVETGTTYIDPAVWTFFQITVLVGNDGLCAVRLNGNSAPDIDFAGDTQAQVSNSVVQVAFGSDGLLGHTTGYYFRPVVCNTDGTANNGLVPAKLTPVHIHPNADGATIWTLSTGAIAYPLIDELVGAPDDADYVETSTLNAKNRCLLAAQTAIGDVAAVQVLSRFEKSGVGTLAVKSGLIAGANEVQSAEKYLPDGISNYLDIFEFKTGSTPFAAADLESGDMEITAQLTAVS